MAVHTCTEWVSARAAPNELKIPRLKYDGFLLVDESKANVQPLHIWTFRRQMGAKYARVIKAKPTIKVQELHVKWINDIVTEDCKINL